MSGKLNKSDFFFAKVSWGPGKGYHILAFDNETDFNFCSWSSYKFEKLKFSEVKISEIPVWEYGNKTLEKINKLKKIKVEDLK